MRLIFLVLIFILQACNTLDVVKEVPRQNIESFASNIESINLDVQMKDGTVYYIDTVKAYQQKNFVLWKQKGSQKVDVGVLDLINFSLTGYKKPYPGQYPVVSESGTSSEK